MCEIETNKNPIKFSRIPTAPLPNICYPETQEENLSYPLTRLLLMSKK
jgi:hypothetical protein